MKALMLFLGLAVAALSLPVCFLASYELKTPEQQLQEFHTETLRRVQHEKYMDSLELVIRLEVAARSPQLFDSQNGKR